MSKYLIVLFAILFPVCAVAEDLAISRLFSQKGVDGTVVIASLKGGETFIHNKNRAEQRFSPASTFKIMNTLIAVEEQAIAGKDGVFKWDGQMYDLPNWNHDQTLASAFQVSCVWCYQELALRIGQEKYQKYLKQSNYGELQHPFDITTFWLDGSLQVSAFEQVHFIKNIIQHRLPFKQTAYDTLQQIMLVEKTPAYSLWAKTGWATRGTPQVGWYVGYVETSTDTWIFALNMVIQSEKDLPLRRELALTALKLKGIIE